MITYTYKENEDVVIKTVTETTEVEIPGEVYRNQLENATKDLQAAQALIDEANTALGIK